MQLFLANFSSIPPKPRNSSLSGLVKKSSHRIKQCSTEYDTVCSIKFENPCETVWERKCVTNFIDDSPHVTYKKEGEDIDVVCVPDKDGIVFIVLNEKFPADSLRAGRTEACCCIPHPGSGNEYILDMRRRIRRLVLKLCNDVL